VPRRCSNTYRFRFAEVTTHDLDADERVNAIWKLSGESLAHSRALLDMLGDGYTAQTWPAMGAIHESNRLLGTVMDHDEDRIAEQWLADKEVKQREAREAEERQAKRITQQMKEASLESPSSDIAGLMRTIYSGMSKGPTTGARWLMSRSTRRPDVHVPHRSGSVAAA
jgi:hypothetical protein